MRVPNIIRISAAVIGLGAALTFVSSVRAQEIENTVWADGPNVAPFEQSASNATAKSSNSATTVAATVKPDAAIASAARPQQAALLQQSPAMGWLFPLVLVCMALVALPALLKAKRATNIGGKELDRQTPQRV